MKNHIMKVGYPILALAGGIWILSGIQPGHAQNIRWLHVGELQAPFSELGAEWETEFDNKTNTSNRFTWPAQYSIEQTVDRANALLIGCRNFNDPVEGKIKSVKVIGSGPKNAADPNQVFPKELKLLGKYPHPIVSVDNGRATLLDQFDLLDEAADENLPCDRMVLIRFNTSMGISVTKKIMAFTQQDQSNYFINDYVFTNTGIIDGAGTIRPQALDSVWIYFLYRNAMNGGLASAGTLQSVWGGLNSLWGESTLNHAFGENPNAPEFNDSASLFYHLRGFYSYYGPLDKTPRPPYDEDWGCPKLNDPGAGTLAAAKYAGCATLHADKSAKDSADDPAQPRTTWFISGDITAFSTTSPSQYDEAFMNDRWALMTEGHPSQQHDEVVGDNYPNNYRDPRRNAGGGVAMGQGFGPYKLEPNDSIHIAFAEGVSGISWEKGREVGANWLAWRNNSPNKPALFNPDGTQEPSDYNEYKRKWVVEAGRDSILKTYRNAVDNYNSGYQLPQPPPPPSQFIVLSGGDRIQLQWANNAATDSHFGGYVIYRSSGNVLDWNTEYEKIFETSDPNVTGFDDVTAKRGFDYFYYIQSKDDGKQISGRTLYSSLFWTVTSIGARLGRPAGTALQNVRVVPNPYDIRARMVQFGDQSQYDRLNFYGLPPRCKLKIYTERGDLIWQKDHTSSTGDEIWDSLTSSGQIIVSGVYILYVEVSEDTYDTWNQMDNRLLYRKGDSVFRKFVVIR